MTGVSQRDLMTLFWQILIDGFAISSLYALGATGFALIFGVSGVLNLSHGALMVAAVVAAWAAGDQSACRTLCRRRDRRGDRLCRFAPHLFRRGAAAAAHAQNPRGGKGDFHPHRDAAVGHHDPAADRLSLHRQRQDRGADRGGRRLYRRRAHAGERDFHRHRVLAGHRGCCGFWSTAPAPARRCSPPR